jgi:hypothetical protein
MDSPSAVGRYLAALGRQDWDALAACLTDDVVRIGPYGDVYEGRDAYVAFLAETLASLPGYELRVERLIVASATVVAELNETIDGPQGRMRTDEAIVFDLAPSGLIRRVGVFLRRTRVTS